MFDVTEIILALIGLATAITTVFAVPWLRTKLGEGKLAQLSQAAYIVVTAAEQIYAKGDNENKLDYAMERLKEIAHKNGITYDDITLRAAIEAAVLSLKNG